ncbi:hypothetical protein INT45_000041 [Circinella minor]|uniref:Enoyl reductase (ER) domain-containing protein n=1 Tax=Circinella minor TaxID=1195481 RepID=A0A8H7RYK6_9FUNG|nr:hypothetical protein INT45_000041 [Circinella minor]
MSSEKGGYEITAYATTDKPGEFEKITYDTPPLKDDEVYIKILAGGVCHTDILFMNKPGVVLGHEPVGEIVDIGAGVRGHKKGEIVGSGYDSMCPYRISFPEGNNNGFAHSVVCKAKFIYSIPDCFTPQEAAPLMCAGLTVFTALHIAQVPPTAHVAIVGIGGLGHIGLQFARAWGCHVTAISHTPSKKEDAFKFGAHEFLCSKDFTPEYIEKAPKFDYILNTVSVNIEWDNYMDLLDSNGQLFMLGIPEGPIVIEKVLANIANQKTLRGSVNGSRYVVDLMLEFAARHNIKPAVVDYPMTPEGISKAIKDNEDNSTRYRAVLTPQH